MHIYTHNDKYDIIYKMCNNATKYMIYVMIQPIYNILEKQEKYNKNISEQEYHAWAQIVPPPSTLSILPKIAYYH